MIMHEIDIAKVCQPLQQKTNRISPYTTSFKVINFITSNAYKTRPVLEYQTFLVFLGGVRVEL